MATNETILGKVSITPRGAYDPSTGYTPLDLISYQGSSYLVLTPFQGMEPTGDNEYTMLVAAKGELGSAMTFDDLTEEQKQQLKGETGKGLTILGQYESLEQLIQQVANPQSGDAYSVGSNYPYDIYIYSSTAGWINNGALQGPAGKSAYQIYTENGGTLSEQAFNKEITQVENKVDKEEGKVLSSNDYTEAEKEKLSTLENYNDEELRTLLEQKANFTEIYPKQELTKLLEDVVTTNTEQEITGPKDFQTAPTINGYKIWHENNDGAGSGLDADLLDGFHSKNYSLAGVNNYSNNSSDQEFTTEEFINRLRELGAFHYNSWSNLSSFYWNGNGFISDTGFGIIRLAGTVAQIYFASEDVYQIHLYSTFLKDVDNITISDIGIRLITYLHVNSNSGYTESPNGWTKQLSNRDFVNNNGNILTTSAIDIPENADLNNYKTIGFYKCMASATAQSLSNSPVDYAFSLFVENNTFDGAKQTLSGHGTVNNNDTFYRTLYNGTWSNWIRVSKASETPQFGIHRTISSLNSIPLANEYVYDIRYTYTDGASTQQLNFGVGEDGQEYKLSIINNGTGKLTVTLPVGENYQKDKDQMEIDAGRIGEISLSIIGTKHILRIIGG